MEFYHSFGSNKAADLNTKVKTPKDFVITVIKVLELVNTWGNSEEPIHLQYPYLYIDTNQLKRAFIVRSNQIVSFAFPFSIYERVDVYGKGYMCINYWDIELNDIIISLAMSIAKSFDFNKSTYASVAKSIDLSDDDMRCATRVFEAVLALEPSYVRYDYDKNAGRGMVHPINHLDLNYNNEYSYKVGLYGGMKMNDFKDFLSVGTDCWYIKPFSIFSVFENWLKERNPFKKRL